MPTYEYACKKCGEHLEVHQSIHDEPLKRHRGGCGGTLSKVFGSPGIVLKGSGFYKTDNGSRSKSDSHSAKNDAKDSPKKSHDNDGSSGSSETTSKSDDGAGSGSDSKSKPKPKSDKTAKAGTGA